MILQKLYGIIVVKRYVPNVAQLWQFLLYPQAVGTKWLLSHLVFLIAGIVPLGMDLWRKQSGTSSGTTSGVHLLC
jgi:hypothetical protein